MPTVNQLVRTARIKQNSRSKAPDLQKNSFKKGVVEWTGVQKPKKPNSAERKVARVRLRSGRIVKAYIGGIDHNVQVHSNVLVRGGRVPDLPGCRYHIVRGKYDCAGDEIRMSKHTGSRRERRRSKYGVKVKE